MARRVLFVIVVVLLTAAFAVYVAAPVEAQETSTEPFTPARFALIDAVVAVSATGNLGPINQNSMFRIDTRSGQVWMLQAQIQSTSNPQILDAVWVPVTDISAARLQQQRQLFEPNIMAD